MRLQQPSAGGDAATSEPAAAGQQDMFALLERGGCSFVQKASPIARVPPAADAIAGVLCLWAGNVVSAGISGSPRRFRRR